MLNVGKEKNSLKDIDTNLIIRKISIAMKKNIRVVSFFGCQSLLLYEGLTEISDNTFIFTEKGSGALTKITFSTTHLKVIRTYNGQETRLYLASNKTSLVVLNNYGKLPINIGFLSIKVDKDKKRYHYFYHLEEIRCIQIELF